MNLMLKNGMNFAGRNIQPSKNVFMRFLTVGKHWMPSKLAGLPSKPNTQKYNLTIQ